ncbi:MAG: Rrf2 family transcriptional regulator [Elusimicrobia bacterium]|nr:Rrf2 family transcriptional regulator [Elusimicrobiota bacterium]
MRITSLVECSTRIMVRLASLQPGATLSAEKLSDLENVSRDYVDQILQRLRKGGLVASTRGAQGGYSLAKASSAISIGELVRAVEGQVFEEVCERYSSGEHECRHMSNCGIRPVWLRLGEMIEGFLDKVTLDQLTVPEPRAFAATMAFIKDFEKEGRIQHDKRR